MCDLVLERVCALLELADRARAGIRGLEACEALRRDHVAVRRADLIELTLSARLQEVAHDVRAQQRERILAGDVVPELFERDRGGTIAVAPQQIDHLTVRT